MNSDCYTAERTWRANQHTGPTPVEERFWGKVVVQKNDCWLWKGGLHQGYGIFWTGGRTVRAHRFAYEMDVGPAPRELHHACGNRACVNPTHLRAVTRQEHSGIHREDNLRGAGAAADNARKTHCPKGHPYDEENTYRNPAGRRECRQCTRERQRAARRRRAF